MNSRNFLHLLESADLILALCLTEMAYGMAPMQKLTSPCDLESFRGAFVGTVFVFHKLVR
jgi:hypothetical protein